jgi:type III secretion system FlhB-like substrate exporter
VSSFDLTEPTKSVVKRRFAGLTGLDSAIALKYDRTLPAPFVVASGRGLLAERLLALAKLNGIPVTSSEELSSRLVFLRPGDIIPGELYEPIARVFAMIGELERQQAKQNERNRG